jgi:glycosyltransferase involved in cell wall biosynthesis
MGERILGKEMGINKMNLRQRSFRWLWKIDFTAYQLTAFLFYPINYLCALCLKRIKGKGVLHICTVMHQPYIMTRYLRDQGFHADFLAKGEGWLSFDEKSWDYQIGRIRLPGPVKFIYEFWWAWRLYPRYQIVHSHFLRMIGTGFWELKYLKMMGKKVVFLFGGDDIRKKEINLQLNPELNCCQECDYPEDYCDDPRKDLLGDLAKRYGDLFLVTTPDLNDFFPEAIHFPFFLPELPDKKPTSLGEKGTLKNTFRIMHVTNHEGIDGTRYIVEAVNKLKEKGYSIELIMPRKVPFQEILSLYPQVDLTIGKLRMGYYANAQIESMYFGIPTMCYIRESFLKKIPDCPIINVRPENLYEKLKYCLDHPDEMVARGRRGLEFVRKYHSGDLLAKRLIDLYQNC